MQHNILRRSGGDTKADGGQAARTATFSKMKAPASPLPLPSPCPPCAPSPAVRMYPSHRCTSMQMLDAFHWKGGRLSEEAIFLRENENLFKYRDSRCAP